MATTISSTPDKDRICTLWVHNRSYSPEDVLLSSSAVPATVTASIPTLQILPLEPSVVAQDFSQDASSSVRPQTAASTAQHASYVLSPAKSPFVFAARPLSEEQHHSLQNLQVSVNEKIASLHGFRNRMSVKISEASESKLSASHVEITFQDPLNRADLWNMAIEEIRARKFVYQGQCLNLLGRIKVSVRKIYRNSQKAPSAFFASSCKPIFRNESANFIIAVQLSREMWHYQTDRSSDIVWANATKFLDELFHRWTKYGSRHRVTIVFFTRLEYSQPSKATPSDSIGSSKTYRDFYRVVASEVPSSATLAYRPQLNKEFRCFLRDVETSVTDPDGHPTVSGEPTIASKGNVLEALSLMIASCSAGDADQDLKHTGTSVVLITPGTGIFDVPNEGSLRVLTQALAHLAVSVELVVLNRVPLHSAPLFRLLPGQSKHHGPLDDSLDLKSSNDTKPNSQAEERHDPISTSNAAHYGRRDRTQPTCVVPAWVNASFYFGQEEEKLHSSHETSKQDFMPRSKQLCSAKDAGDFYAAPGTLPTFDNFLPALKFNSMTTPSLPTPDPTEVDLEDFKKWLNQYDKDVFTSMPGRAVPGLGINASKKTVSNKRLSSPTQNPKTKAIQGSDAQEEPQIPKYTGSAKSTKSKSSNPPAPKFGSLLGGRNLGKASATTSSTSEHAKSTSNVFQKSLEEVQDPRSWSGHVRASLARKSSSMSMKTTETSKYSTTEDSKDSKEELAEQDAFNTSGARQQSALSAVQPVSGGLDSNLQKPNLIDSSKQKAKTSHDIQNDSSVPWEIIPNPFSRNDFVTTPFREWSHVLPKPVSLGMVKWRALGAPASLPLTTEYSPHIDHLRTHFSGIAYKVTLREDAENKETIAERRAHVVKELVQVRIAEGYQVSVGTRFSGDRSSSQLIDLLGKDFMAEVNGMIMLLKGDNVHVLRPGDREIIVSCYQRRSMNSGTDVCTAYMRTLLETQYRPLVHEIKVPEDLNWRVLDQSISDVECGTEEQNQPPHLQPALKPRRVRFVLLPVDSDESVRAISGDLDEEIRTEGIRKLTILWNRFRYTAPEKLQHRAAWTGHDDPNPLAIEYQTRDPSAVVTAGHETSLLVDGETNIAAPTQLFDEYESYRTSHVDLYTLASDLHSSRGIKIGDRRWHFRLFHHCFVGADLVGYLLSRFQDIQSRDEAVEFGNVLMKKYSFFSHVDGRHAFRDGHFFYSIAKDYRIPKAEIKSWFNLARSVPPTPLSDKSTEINSQEPSPFAKPHFKRPKVRLSAAFQYNVDPRRLSSRHEVVSLHYDRLHNPDNAFHFQLEWNNATTKLIEDAVISWAINVSRHGLKLVQVPLSEVSMMSTTNLLRTPYPIELALKPSDDQQQQQQPSETNHPESSSTNFTTSPSPTIDQTIYQKALFRKFNFVLDFEAASSFPTDVDVTYSWGDPQYKHTQFVHKSGMLLAQMIDNYKFLLLANRLYHDWSAGTRGSSSAGARLIGRSSDHLPSQQTAELLTPEKLKDDFEAFCHDKAALRDFYEEVSQGITAGSERPTPSVSTSTPTLTASIPSLELPPRRWDEDVKKIRLDTPRRE